MKRTELAAIGALIMLGVGYAGATDFSAWEKKCSIAFSGYSKSETLTNFPVLVVLSTSISNFSYSQFASSTGGDLRFSASNGTTELNYEIEKWNTSGSSYVWVRVPALSGSSDSIWAYWGNSGQTTPPACTTNGSTWSAGYVSVWHLGQNPTSGAVIADSAVLNNGTFYKTSSYATNGAAGQGIKFGGANPDYAKILDSASLRLTNKLSVSVWIKGWDNENGICFAAKSGTQGDPISSGWRLGKQSDTGKIMFRLYGGIGDLYTANNVDSILSDGNWHSLYAYATYGQQAIYLDGTLNNTGSVNAWPVATDTNPVTIGATWINLFPNPDGPSGFCENSLDELRIGSTARSSNWIWACYMTMASNTVFSSYGSASEQALTGPVIRIK